MLRASGGAGVTYIIPSAEQHPGSAPVGYQCVYESYFGDHTKLWFPIPRLVTSYAFRQDISISQLLNGSLRIAVMLMVMAAEMDISMSVRVFEELTFTKAQPNGIFSVKMRLNYNVLTGHPNKTHDWQHAYFFVKSDEHAFEEPPGDDYRFVIRIRSPTSRSFSKVLNRSRRIVIFVGRILVGSGYVVSKLGSLELIGSRGFLCFGPRKSLPFVYSQTTETSRQSHRNGRSSGSKRSVERKVAAAHEEVDYSRSSGTV
ncbi:hypothetical protein Bca52824_087512 [Brassica carinata]|uniref:Uncharacterized protein n=1 Tax=Brassica carinata TaxID=52824 RepID=A0A8X7PDU9_BRACI|nr:hypothetical protein Bca52824_087512 [Brassica carinata]